MIVCRTEQDKLPDGTDKLPDGTDKLPRRFSSDICGWFYGPPRLTLSAKNAKICLVHHGKKEIGTKEIGASVAQEKLERYLHFVMCGFGGFMGGYAVLARNNLLGSAQTSNLISMVEAFLGGNIQIGLFRVLAMVLYAAAIALTVLIPKRTKWDLRLFSLMIDFPLVLLLGFLPADLNYVLGLCPLFFMMAVQWNAFPGADGYISASIFSTNNLRQAVMALTEYLCERQASQRHKAIFYGLVLLCFHLGVAAAYFAYQWFGVQGIWCSYVPLCGGLGLYLVEQRMVLPAKQPGCTH